nr:hypothetical protein [uncultured Holophaga sp.]
MSYTREELDWIEAEWAFHLHGRSAFLSREDFTTLQKWDREGLPAETLVACMGAYFERRARRPRGRAFVALEHLEKDVAKALKLRESLKRAGVEAPKVAGWERVKEPLHSDPKARAAFESWAQLHLSAPGPDSPGFLDHFDREREARQALLEVAAERLDPGLHATLSRELEARLREAHIQPDSFVWQRAWEHHWGQAVAAAWGLPAEG